MQQPRRRWWGVSRLLGAALCGVVLAVAGPRPVSAGDPAVHEDLDYRFRITSPGAGWELMGEAEAQRFVPDAIAALTHVGGAWFLVIAEESPGADLDAIAAQLRASMSVEAPSFGPVETLTYQGVPARRWWTEGKVDGIESRFRYLVCARGSFVFQLVAYGPKAPPRGAPATDFEVLERHLTFTEGPIRARKVVAATHDASGPGWRMRGGVYEDAANAVEVRPPPGWRVAVGAELRRIDVSACVGLVASDPEAFVTVVVERVRGVEEGALVEKARAAAEAGWTPVGAPTTARVGGKDFRMQAHRMRSGMTFQIHRGVRSVDGRCVQVDWWAGEAVLDRAAPAARAALESIRFLDAARVAVLAGELAAGVDAENTVGEGFGLSRGVYRDFAQGFTWMKPGGFWTVRTGQDAREAHEDATIFLSAPALGLEGVVIVEPWAESDAAALHRALVEAHDPADGVPKPQRVGLAGAEALSSRVVSMATGLPKHHVLTSVLRDGRAYLLQLWGLKGNVAAAKDAIDAAAQGLAFPPRLVATERSDAAYVDHRLRYRLRAPSTTGWRLAVHTPAATQALGSIVSFTRGQSEVVGGAMCALSEGQDEGVVRDLVLRVLRKQVGGGGVPEESEATVGRRPARRFVLTQGGRRVFAWLTQRERTFYFVVAHDLEGTGVRDEDAHQLFGWLD